MSARQKLDAGALSEVMGGRPPPTYDRSGRVMLIGEVAQALLANRAPSREAAMFVAGALLSWLQKGGSLERDYFRVTKRASHHTPDVIWNSLIADEGLDDDSGRQ